MTSTTHVIILAQGNQSRLSKWVTGPKCLLPLPACNSIPILNRTLLQVWKLLAPDLGGVNESDYQPYNDHRITVVSWYEVKKHFELTPVTIPSAGGAANTNTAWDAWWSLVPEVYSLADPGNSSLKGCARYLREAQPRRKHIERTIILLGDVVYSWRCLDALFSWKHDDFGLFAGTSDLGPGGGELWGISWSRSAEPLMMSTLESALAKHPKFEEYQPGQLRNWLWEVDKADSKRVGLGHDAIDGPRKRVWFRHVDDYTMDVDLPEHIKLLGVASERAAIDDREHGVTW